jgi:hypothetical protein
MSIKISGYIVGEYQNGIILRIDKEDNDKICAKAEKFGHLINYVSYSDCREDADTKLVKVSTKWCKMVITDLTWSSVKDLIGVEIYCYCKVVPYAFETESGKKEGVYIKANTIKNVV